MCGYGLVGRDRRARPKVSAMGLMKGNILDTHKCLCAAAVPFLDSMLAPERLSGRPAEWAPTWWSATYGRASWAVEEGDRVHAP